MLKAENSQSIKNESNENNSMTNLDIDINFNNILEKNLEYAKNLHNSLITSINISNSQKLEWCNIERNFIKQYLKILANRK